MATIKNASAQVVSLPVSGGSPAIATTTRHRWMLPLLLVGQAMAAMDTSIVNVAAPALRQDLGISGALLQMVVAGYVLAYAVFLVSGARLGDDYGYRKLFVIGVSIFTASSLVCGLAPFTSLLVVGRVIQGLGAALMVPQVLSLIQRHFEGAERARAIGYYSMILGMGSALGQLLGGAIITVNILGSSWRPAFLINVPIGLALLCYAGSVLPDTRGKDKRKLDIVGVIALTLSMLLIVVPLIFGQEVDWQSWTWISMGFGVLGLIVFGLFEKMLARRGGNPLINLDAVFAPGVRIGLLVVSIGFIGYGGWLFVIALYLQSGLGFSPMISGFVFTAYALGFGLSNLHWSKLPARLLRWTPTAAFIAMATANLLFGVAALHWGWKMAAMLPLLFVAGSSHGLSFGTVVNQMTGYVPPAQAPALSGLVTTTVQLSIVIGIATLGTLYFAVLKAGSAASGISWVNFTVAAGATLAAVCSVQFAMRRRA
ncbi:MFS transporter [Paraherbaspirillum soli]|uniref:MFS transporter n=1 Tax=Paraherbaspirillum soli TaxID=631222 RepID=A0ABW0M9G7_9BURK